MNTLISIAIAFSGVLGFLGIVIGGMFLYSKKVYGLFGVVLGICLCMIGLNLNHDYQSFSCDTIYLDKLRTDVVTKYPDLIPDYYELVNTDIDVTVGEVWGFEKKIKKLENERLLKMAK